MVSNKSAYRLKQELFEKGAKISSHTACRLASLKNRKNYDDFHDLAKKGEIYTTIGKNLRGSRATYVALNDIGVEPQKIEKPFEVNQFGDIIKIYDKGILERLAEIKNGSYIF